MTALELALNILAETATAELSKTKNPRNFVENQIIAKEGGSVSKNARKDIEKRSGRPVISNKNAKTFGYKAISELK